MCVGPPHFTSFPHAHTGMLCSSCVSPLSWRSTDGTQEQGAHGHVSVCVCANVCAYRSSESWSALERIQALFFSPSLYITYTMHPMAWLYVLSALGQSVWPCQGSPSQERVDTLGAAYSPNTRPLPANQNLPVSSGTFPESNLGISAYANRTAACSPAGHGALKIGISA